MRRGIWTWWRGLAACAILAVIVVAVASAPAHIPGAATVGAAPAAAVTVTVTPTPSIDVGDTSGGNGTFIQLITILFGRQGILHIHVPSKFKHPGFWLAIPRPLPHRTGIVNGDTVRVSLSKDGTFSLRVSKSNNSLLSGWYPPITMQPPAGTGHWILEALGKDGKYHALRHNLVSGPGVFKWVLASVPTHPHP